MSAEKEKDADMSIEMKKISATLYSRSKEAEICGKKDESNYCKKMGYYKVGEFHAIYISIGNLIELIIPSLADFVFHKENGTWVCYKILQGCLHKYILIEPNDNTDNNNWSMFDNDMGMVRQINYKPEKSKGMEM